MSRITMTEIDRHLEQHHSARCMDSPNDRRVVALALATMLNQRIEAEVCDDCGHLEEVHVCPNNAEPGCLGGPETHCDCQGFRKDAP